MDFFRFMHVNARWLAGAFLLTFFSSFGQTFFISLSAGDIRAEYALSHGQFGGIYMAATLASALTLPWFGQIVDRISTRQVTLIIMPALAVAAVSMALAHHLAVLVVTIYMLRLFGQGMMTHNALTATGRWFERGRGRAMSIAVIGHQAGEALFPIAFVALVAAIGWRSSWLTVAVILIAIALPLTSWLNGPEREPREPGDTSTPAAPSGWTRAEVLRDPVFYLLLLGVMGPGFIGTTVFFHQIYLTELRGWPREAFALAFMMMAAMTLLFALISGQLIDRFSAKRMLPSFLLPMGLGCFVLGFGEAEWSVYAFMGLMGVSYGIASTLFGALWPEVYGLKHLGAIRSLTVAIMVFATAAGPGLTGYLIDNGVSYPLQVVAMGVYCFVAAAVLAAVSRVLIDRSAKGAANQSG